MTVNKIHEAPKETFLYTHAYKLDFVLHTSEDFLFGKSIHAEKD